MTDTKSSTALDLEAIHGRIAALRNTTPGHSGEDPYVVHAYEYEDGDDCRTIELDEYDSGHFPLESRVYVADHCLMATVPTCEGALMHDTAKAIAMAGADMLALLADNKRKDSEIEGLRAALLTVGRAFGCGLGDDVSSEFLGHVPAECIEVQRRAKVEAERLRGCMDEVLQALNDGRDELAVVLLVRGGATIVEGSQL